MTQKAMKTNEHTPVSGTGLLALVAEAMQLEQKILALAEEHGGEIDIHLEEYLSTVQKELAHKADNYKFIMDRLEITSAQLEKTGDQFFAAANALDYVKEAMKDRIKIAMQTMGTDEVKGEMWKFKLSKTKGRLVLVEDFTTKLPSEYIDTQTVLVPNKEKIRTALEAGVVVPGAEIIPGFSLRPSVNKGT